MQVLGQKKMQKAKLGTCLDPKHQQVLKTPRLTRGPEGITRRSSESAKHEREQIEPTDRQLQKQYEGAADAPC